ncbi:MAG: DUF3096 domain-containing protein [Nanoarchaeota archaeon]
MAKKVPPKNLMGILWIVFGLIIIIWPGILEFVVGAYLIITGILSLTGS